MKTTAFVLVLLLALGVLAATPAAAAPLHASSLRDYVSAPCAPGATYDSACDVNHDGVVNVLDVQLAAGHWNQTGVWTGGGDGWSLTGNAGTNPATNFLGTTDGQPLAIQPAGGNVGIGTSTPNARFNVVGTSWFQGDSTPLPAAAGKGIAIGFTGEQGYIYGFDYATWTYKDLRVQHAGGKVVIGSSTPAAAKLTVVAPAGETGVFVSSTSNNGVEVHSAGWNGVSVGVAGANGVYVVSALTGIRVNSADDYGVRVDSAAAGVYVQSASYGVEVVNAGYGVYVASAAYGVDVAGTSYAGYFDGNINVNGNCFGCLQANFAVNAGDRALQPGDLVSVQAVTSTDFDAGATVWQVVAAQPGQAVVGVVAGRAELVFEEEHRPTETGKRLVPREGASQPGEYITIVYSGPMQVKATDRIAAGEKLTIDDDGNARGLRKTEVNGVPVAEDAPVLGIALNESQDGMVWVLVNPQ